MRSGLRLLPGTNAGGQACYPFIVDMRQIKRAARRQGWTVEVTGGEHLKWTPPDGQPIVYSGSTPSDQRALANMLARLRKSGFVAPGRGRGKQARTSSRPVDSR